MMNLHVYPSFSFKIFQHMVNVPMVDFYKMNPKPMVDNELLLLSPD